MTDKIPEMVERIGRIIARQSKDCDWQSMCSAFRRSDPDSCDCLDAAREAIEAMRIPTDQMLAIGGEEGCWDERIVSAAPSAKAALEVWQHMITEALK